MVLLSESLGDATSLACHRVINSESYKFLLICQCERMGSPYPGHFAIAVAHCADSDWLSSSYQHHLLSMSTAAACNSTYCIGCAQVLVDVTTRLHASCASFLLSQQNMKPKRTQQQDQRQRSRRHQVYNHPTNESRIVFEMQEAWLHNIWQLLPQPCNQSAGRSISASCRTAPRIHSSSTTTTVPDSRE
jgi:hypothetical protein